MPTRPNATLGMVLNDAVAARRLTRAALHVVTAALDTGIGDPWIARDARLLEARLIGAARAVRNLEADVRDTQAAS